MYTPSKYEEKKKVLFFFITGALELNDVQND